ncbi:hypothetical protein LJB98_00440 [Bacteroidales bacterium OttesenSCG-928-M11]|nr:hypothetical protein [Bacteroidales bacterium OttesenSCG-928-M11]
MKKLLLLLLACFTCSGVWTQEYDFSDLKGLKNIGELKKPTENIYFSLQGYEVYITTINKSFSDTGAKYDFAKKKQLGNVAHKYTLPNTDYKHSVWVFESEALADSLVFLNRIAYFLEKDSENTQVVLFMSYNPRDTLLEEAFVSEYMKGNLNDQISEDWIANEILFAGEEIRLGNACHWRGVNNVYFQGGQVSWTEHLNQEQAILDRNRRILGNNENLVVLEEEEINILFRGKETVAKRVAYLPKEMGYYKGTLIVYYVAIELNGYYISCVLSNYGYNRNDYELSLLLQEFMEIPELPYFAHNLFDYPVYEAVHEEQIDPFRDDIHYVGMGVGSWIPIGKLANSYNPGISFHFTLGIPVQNNFAVDLLFQFSAPLGREYFDCTYKNETERTEIDFVALIGLRARHQHKLRNNLFLNTYAGLGCIGLQTDLVKGYDKNDDEEYLYITSMDIHAGTSLRYKNVALFFEYHYSPYAQSRKVESNFGTSSLNLGLTFSY